MLFINQIKYANFPTQFATALEPKLKSSCYHWFTLLKPRVLALVIFTATCGVLLAPGHLNFFLAFISIVCICAASGACGAINMWFDRDIDALMRRTCSRPIPAGQISPSQVLALGTILAAGSIILMGLVFNVYAACILMLSISFYLIVYTSWLKRRTPQNIVIGGVAGAFPPIIGWVSVTGNINSLSLIMFAIIFIWTPSHFWCLALWTKDDYVRADVPMLPVTTGELYTRQTIVWYTVLLVALSEMPTFIGSASNFYALMVGVIGLKYISLVCKVLNDSQDSEGKSLSGDGPAKKAFRYSIWYLFLLFAILVIDGLLR